MVVRKVRDGPKILNHGSSPLLLFSSSSLLFFLPQSPSIAKNCFRALGVCVGWGWWAGSAPASSIALHIVQQCRNIVHAIVFYGFITYIVQLSKTKLYLYFESLVLEHGEKSGVYKWKWSGHRQICRLGYITNDFYLIFLWIGVVKRQDPPPRYKYNVPRSIEQNRIDKVHLIYSCVQLFKAHKSQADQRQTSVGRTH